jgi:hypothetical protein
MARNAHKVYLNNEEKKYAERRADDLGLKPAVYMRRAVSGVVGGGSPALRTSLRQAALRAERAAGRLGKESQEEKVKEDLDQAVELVEEALAQAGGAGARAAEAARERISEGDDASGGEADRRRP